MLSRLSVLLEDQGGEAADTQAAPSKRTDTFLKSFSFWIPRKHREGIMSDIHEDCGELRALGKSERRVRLNAAWQLFLAGATAILGSIRTWIEALAKTKAS